MTQLDGMRKYLKERNSPIQALNYFSFMANKHQSKSSVSSMFQGDATGMLSPKRGLIRRYGHTDLKFLSSEDWDKEVRRVRVLSNVGTAKKQHLFNYLHPNQFDCTSKD